MCFKYQNKILFDYETAAIVISNHNIFERIMFKSFNGFINRYNIVWFIHNINYERHRHRGLKKYIWDSDVDTEYNVLIFLPCLMMAMCWTQSNKGTDSTQISTQMLSTGFLLCLCDNNSTSKSISRRQNHSLKSHRYAFHAKNSNLLQALTLFIIVQC